MNTFKKVLNLSLFVFAIVFVLSSCGKETYEVNPTSQKAPNTTSTNTNALAMVSNQNSESNTDTLGECFTFNFPLTVNVPGEGDQVVANEEELFDLLNAYMEEAGEDAAEFPTLVFPLDVTLEDGTTQTVQNDEELFAIFEACYPIEEGEGGGEEEGGEGEELSPCFEFVYPITVVSNGEETVLESEEDWALLMDTTSEEPLYYEVVFPIDVTMEDGSTQTLNNEDELSALFEECYGDLGDLGGDCDSTVVEDLCFQFVFPLTLNMPDGSTVSAEDDEALFEILTIYFEQYPDAEAAPELAFPLDIVLLEDESTQTVNSEAELQEVIESCIGDGFGLVSQGNAVIGLNRLR